MPLARIAAEGLLLFLFRIAGAAFLAWALATMSFPVAALPLRGPDAPAWLGILFRAWLLIAGTFFATALVLFAARPSRPPAGGEAAALPRATAALLALSLVALPALSHARAADLVALWREILVLLDRVGLWNAFESGGANSGLVLLPVLAALLVPALEAAAAVFLIAVPPALLALLLTHSPLLPRIFAMLAACQAGLVLASLIGADAFSRLATELIAAMTAAAPDAEVLRAAEMLRGAEGVLGSTARGFVVPTLGYLVWTAILLLRRQALPLAGEDAEREATPWSAAPAGAPTPPPPARPEPIAPAKPALRLPLGTSGVDPFADRARIGLVALGALLLVFSAAHALASRARYESSDPAPGATLAAPPALVRVSFRRALDPSSYLHVDRTAPGEAAIRVAVSSGLDPEDPERRTLRAALPGAPGGLYRVTWRSLPASGRGVARHGSLVFSVGTQGHSAVPAGEPPLEERDAGGRRQRRIATGGALLIALGLLSPLARPR